MPETVIWSYAVRAESGPAVSQSDRLAADAYEKINLILAPAATQAVTIGPDGWPAIRALIVTGSDLSGAITLTPDGGAAMPLNGPLLLLGAGPVGLLGAGTATVAIENTGGAEQTVDIFVARDATP